MRRTVILVTALIILLALGVGAVGQQRDGAQGAGQGRGGGGRGPQTPPLILTTTAWADGTVIPAKYVGQMGVSPELKWSQVPMGTMSFALIMHDPDVALQRGTGDVLHWMIWNIPGTATGLKEGVAQGAELPDGSRQVSLRGNGYMGPGAPPNGPYHHYTFELFALDAKVEVPTATPQEAATARAAVLKAMEGHILGKAVWVGLFHQ